MPESVELYLYLRTFNNPAIPYQHYTSSKNVDSTAANCAVEVFRSIYNRQKASWTFFPYRDRVETLVLRDLVYYARRDLIACHYAC
jgi:hypothetical protein